MDLYEKTVAELVAHRSKNWSKAQQRCSGDIGYLITHHEQISRICSQLKDKSTMPDDVEIKVKAGYEFKGQVYDCMGDLRVAIEKLIATKAIEEIYEGFCTGDIDFDRDCVAFAMQCGDEIVAALDDARQKSSIAVNAIRTN